MIADSLACYRLTRLIVDDTITDPLRARLVEADHPVAGFFAEVTDCRWCTGIWVGMGVMVLRRLAPRLWGPVADGLALAAIAGLLSVAEEWGTQPHGVTARA